MVPSVHVLVVEPEPAVRDLVADLLSDAGMEVTTAYGGDDARRVLSVFAVDVVVGALDAAPSPIVPITTPVREGALVRAIREAVDRR